MAEDDWLAKRFEEHRTRLRSVARRMVGSPSEADDAVQEAWLRFSRADTRGVDDLGSWLVTVVSRICLNMLQTRRSRAELSIDSDGLEPPSTHESSVDPEQEALVADSIGVAMLVVLETLNPAERVAFVLHDMFAVPFDEIAPIIGRSVEATRKLASRARRRVRRRESDGDRDGIHQARLIDAFLAAARQGDFKGLLDVLDPDVVLRADEAAVKMGAPDTRGANAVASWFAGRAGGARPALVDGRPGAVWMPGGRPRVAFAFSISGDKIVAIELVGSPARIRQMNLLVPD